jgi:molecular chaperone GrpE
MMPSQRAGALASCALGTSPMGDTPEKGAFQADIPTKAVEEALRSVERVTRREDDPGAAEAVAVEVEGAPEPPSPDTAAAGEAERLEAQLALSQEKARETLEKLKDEHERRLRAAADLENYKKRALREREEIQKFGIEKLVKDLLPVVDNLDRALAGAPAGAFADGVRLVRSGFEQALAKNGVKGFSALGLPFDPALHEALLQVASADAKPGTVVLEHARGFLLHERLVRPAMVGVAVAPPPAGAQAAAGAAPAAEAPAPGGPKGAEETDEGQSPGGE